jgi:hypothetical protein
VTSPDPSEPDPSGGVAIDVAVVWDVAATLRAHAADLAAGAGTLDRDLDLLPPPDGWPVTPPLRAAGAAAHTELRRLVAALDDIALALADAADAYQVTDARSASRLRVWPW